MIDLVYLIIIGVNIALFTVACSVGALIQNKCQCEKMPGNASGQHLHTCLKKKSSQGQRSSRRTSRRTRERTSPPAEDVSMGSPHSSSTMGTAGYDYTPASTHSLRTSRHSATSNRDSLNSLQERSRKSSRRSTRASIKDPYGGSAMKVVSKDDLERNSSYVSSSTVPDSFTERTPSETYAKASTKGASSTNDDRTTAENTVSLTMSRNSQNTSNNSFTMTPNSRGRRSSSYKSSLKSKSRSNKKGTNSNTTKVLRYSNNKHSPVTSTTSTFVAMKNLE